MSPIKIGFNLEVPIPAIIALMAVTSSFFGVHFPSIEEADIPIKGELYPTNVSANKNIESQDIHLDEEMP